MHCRSAYFCNESALNFARSNALTSERKGETTAGTHSQMTVVNQLYAREPVSVLATLSLLFNGGVVDRPRLPEGLYLQVGPILYKSGSRLIELERSHHSPLN